MAPIVTVTVEYDVAGPEITEFSDFDDGRYSGINWANSGRSLVGSGVDRTIYRMTPNTSTFADYVAGLAPMAPNQCTLIKLGGADSGHIQTGLEVAGITLQGTEQGHMYNGLKVGYSEAANIHDLKVTNVPGNDIAPPGETFLMSLWHANNATVTDVILDGGGIGATISGNNNCIGTVFINCQFLNSGCAMPLASWQSRDFTFENCVFINAQRGVNIENPYGGFHTFKNCTFGKYTYPWQINIQGGVWVTADGSTKSTLLTIEDPVWDFDKDGPFTVRHFPHDRYPKNVQSDSDIHLIVDGADVTGDPSKFQFTTAGL